MLLCGQPTCLKALAPFTAMHHGKLLCMQDFCRRVMTANVAVMASGGAPPTYRFYFHGQRADREDRVLIETVVSKSTGTASVTVKADDAQTPDQFATVYKMLLSNLA